MSGLQKGTVKKSLFLENGLFGVATTNTGDYCNWKGWNILGLGMVSLSLHSLWFLVEHTTWVRAWSCTSWSSWLSLPQLLHYRMIGWTNNIQLIYISHIVTRKGRKKKHTIWQESRMVILSENTFNSFLKGNAFQVTSVHFKKCHLMWKPFGEKKQKSHW